MNKRTLISLVVAGVILIGGGAAFFATRDNSDNNSNNSTSGNTNRSASSTPSFNPLATTGQSFVAKMNGTQTDGKTYSATIESDGKGTTKQMTTVSGKTTTSYTTDGTYIVCVGDTCYKTSTASNSTPSSYNVDSGQVTEWKKSVSYEGKASCSTGTCDKWKSTFSTGTAEVYVDGSGHVVKSVVTAGGNTFTTEYTYKAVTITLPTNVQTNPYSGALGN